ncbi:MAG: 16S rRNA (guanine(966)-N(2))-methyltransferase RsmD [Gammaproteobacteria bacterium]|nr:16S rRNA (guanine(966)-N(2))-methyltransferase RsmD [Gammaproteobacteria bacterium]MBT3490480.1 16S rRNA (guanine(966)-N(2))-methyltransferase RsmD [Gammaproteobacteria bacterium]MBT3717589.1 16S rRNA (guanine(966)-N(2))-methyltransferase RsmD [Gammaproteobacteria bacterium]MBT3845782.1 16S rRNA (guanine(966)-N(2))-methyltransferase RsmD [Gammaproteobacteria bacterium]MBT3893642.1 16S rRNA (guanine(966)-N(2))-methyltransferase RsmD [Gammaproteobacteria bacterium]
MRGKRGGNRRLRIIGGVWRGRQLTFADHPEIRPTPDRVRETLFNWLQMSIRGAHCLDLFAGSGALGLEALSRGAADVDFVEKDRNSAQTIRDHLNLLQSDQGKVHSMDAFRFLQQNGLSQYDLVFLDPPFGRSFLEMLFSQLEALQQDIPLKLYIEYEKQLSNLSLPEGWVVSRSGEAGQVVYSLIERSEEASL